MGVSGDADSIRIVFGLGNPGLAYRDNRHNSGFLFLDHLLSRDGTRLVRRERGCRSVLEWVELWERSVLLVRPQTFMNLSGEAYVQVLDREAASPRQSLVVYDDLDLLPGSFRIRERGSAGGHRGMASIIERAGTTEIPRLRLGIGRADRSGDAVGYVLADFSPEERALLSGVFDRSAEALRTILLEGIQPAMCRHNQAGAASPEVEADGAP